MRQIRLTHGDTVNGTSTNLYTVWRSMKCRCFNKTHKAYKYYGARGISIYNKWKNSYISFKQWAINNGYVKNLSIDRINNDGNYEPRNCQWITRSENLKKRHKEANKLPFRDKFGRFSFQRKKENNNDMD